MNSFEHLNDWPYESIGFDYAGVYCPAQDVPSSFLEKRSLPTGEVVFAIGDTGPRPDALPVLCVQRYLRRGQGERSTDPVLAAESMNQLIYDCCGASCSLSCFYAEYSRYSRILRYVNAGHDAPVLVRSDPEEVLHLEQGGPVFGLRESSVYIEGLVTLKKGDRLVAFTQGVIESLACRNGPSAERALISLARNRRSASAFDLANRIVAECEADRCGKKAEKSVFVASIDELVGSHRDNRSEAICVPATLA